MIRRPVWLAVALGVCMALVGFASAAGRMLMPETAILAYGSAYDIWITDLTRGVTRPLTHDKSRFLDDSPSWSPDGARLVYTTVRSLPDNPNLPNGEIAVTGMDGRDFQLLTHERAWDDDAAWSPTGGQIAFRSNRDSESGGTAIYVIDLAAPEISPRRVFEDPARSDLVPSWSPDGTRLILSATIDGAIRVVSVDPASGATEILLARTAYDPRISPDGKFLAVWMPVFEGYTLAVGAVGEVPTAMTRTSLNPAPYAWSPDSLTIAFAATEDALSVIKLLDIASGETVVVLTVPSRVSGIAWRP